MKPQLLVSVFSDYICPFCYIGHLRLARLRDEYDLRIDWRFLEIHPDNPCEGRSLSELGYPPDQWRQMMDNLSRMAEEEGVKLAERSFTTNSHKALLLAEAAKSAGPETFYRLHERLFEAYFLQRQNLGDANVLRDIARQCGVADALVERAWSQPDFEQILQANLRDAAQRRITGTPTFLFGNRMIAGAVPVTTLRQLAATAR